jgi:hypothetical protein
MIIYFVSLPLLFASFLVLSTFIYALSQPLELNVTSEQSGSGFSLLPTGSTVSADLWNSSDSSTAMASSISVATATEASRPASQETVTYVVIWKTTDTLSANLTSSKRTEVITSEDGAQQLRWSTLFLCVLVVATAFGNILLCLAVVTERRLQNMTNYFLTSLAIADLLVSLLVMPLGLVNELFGKQRMFVVLDICSIVGYTVTAVRLSCR